MADALPIELIAHTIEDTVISCHSQNWFEGKNSLQVIMTSLYTRGWRILPVAEGPYPWFIDLTRGELL